jgi:hypothetical protein
MTDFKKILKYQICPVGAEKFHADRRHEVDVAFCSFANVPVNPTHCHCLDAGRICAGSSFVLRPVPHDSAIGGMLGKLRSILCNSSSLACQ